MSRASANYLDPVALEAKVSSSNKKQESIQKGLSLHQEIQEAKSCPALLSQLEIDDLKIKISAIQVISC